jgi:Domain of unknown function (DUF4124)
MRSLLFTLISVVCSVATAATVYKWVDEDGVVHYSDQPHPNAQKLQLQEAQTYKAPPVESTRANGAANAQPASSALSGYQGCAIVQPTDNQDFANIASLTVVVQTDPRLRPGDQVFVTYDGQPLNGSSATGGTFVISPVDRGTHSLQAVVRSSDGTIMCQSSGVTFNVHQPSLLNPANPIKPH